MYSVSTTSYSGPLDKLLELIEEKKLDVTLVSLAAITSDFIDYIKTLQDAAPKILADFVAVASRLMLIKSKVLLPGVALSETEESAINELQDRIALYRELKSAIVALRKKISHSTPCYSRTIFQGGQQYFYPSKNLNSSHLHDAIQKIQQNIELLIDTKETHTVKRALQTLEETIKELLIKFELAGNDSFHTIIQGRVKSEIVILFLALLHLVKQQRIQITQESQFDDIQVNNATKPIAQIQQ